jgi:hypothetical protein
VNPDIAALLGEDPQPIATPTRRRRQAPREPVPPLETVDLGDVGDSPAGVRQNAIKLAGSGRAFIDVGVLRRPVSMNFLALLFDMDPATVKKRLLRCPEIGKAGGGRPVYDFREAVAFLLPPQMDIGEYIESIDPKDLPNHINRAYWGALRERRKALLEMGDAWSTDNVLAVLGGVFLELKGWVQLLPDTMRERCGLTDAQFDAMTEAGDALQGELHRKLLEMPKKGQTRSLAADFDGSVEVEEA